MKALFVNHTGSMSGGERSLLDLLTALPGDVSAVAAAPAGPFADAARAQGERVVEIPAAEAGLRLDPVRTPLALVSLARSALAVARLARRERADVVHANSLRAGLVAAGARRLGAPRAVVYVHDCLPPSRAASLTRRAIRSSGAVVLANSDYTAANFAAGDDSARVRTSYNGMVGDDGELVSLHGAPAPQRATARRHLGIEGSAPVIGVVAQITPWKGQDTAIEALAHVRREHPDARLLLAGEAKFVGAGTSFDNREYLEGLHRTAARLGLADAVELLGERDDALEVIAALDVLAAPSWEEPFGRVVVEAMALGTPVVATSVGGPAEIVEDGVSGRLVSPRDPRQLGDALSALLSDDGLRERFAAEGRRAAARFTLSRHAGDVLSAYAALGALGAPSQRDGN